MQFNTLAKQKTLRSREQGNQRNNSEQTEEVLQFTSHYCRRTESVAQWNATCSSDFRKVMADITNLARFFYAKNL